MFKLGSHFIMQDGETILNKLRDELILREIDKLRIIKKGANNLQFTCPIHNQGQEQKPSCGMSLIDRKTSDDKIIPAGTVHCFTCGFTGDLSELVSNAFGYDDGGREGKNWLVRNFITMEADGREGLSFDISRKKIERPKKPEYISDDELDSYRYYHDYMFERKLNNDLITMFDVGYDPNFKLYDAEGHLKGELEAITFPVRDESGGTLFIGRRGIHMKLFHYPTGVEKPVYGIYEWMTYQPEATEIIICESFFNAITCWKYGKVGVALMGLGTPEQYKYLARHHGLARKFIIGLDPDEAGMRAAEKFKSAMREYGILVTHYDLPKDKDINDLTEKEFQNLSEFF